MQRHGAIDALELDLTLFGGRNDACDAPVDILAEDDLPHWAAPRILEAMFTTGPVMVNSLQARPISPIEACPVAARTLGII